MRKLLALLLILLFIPCVSNAGDAAYSPGLEMTMEDFVSKYNALGSSLDSPLMALKVPTKWTVFNGQNVAWFKADSKSGVTILLLSKDKGAGKKLSAGLDEIQIYTSKASEFQALITVAMRCADLYASEILTLNIAPYAIAQVISYYYDNNYDNSGYTSYQGIDVDQKFIINYWHTGSDYYFSICPKDAN